MGGLDTLRENVSISFVNSAAGKAMVAETVRQGRRNELTVWSCLPMHPLLIPTTGI